MNWQLKRTDTSEVTELHRQYSWTNRYKWAKVAQSNPVYLLDGGVDIQQGIKKAGQPVKLDGSRARISRGVLNKIRALADVPELQFELTSPSGEKIDVIFDRPFITDERAIKDIRPEDESDDDPFVAHLHFLSSE